MMVAETAGKHKISTGEKVFLALAGVVAVYALYVSARNRNAAATAASMGGGVVPVATAAGTAATDLTSMLAALTKAFTDTQTGINTSLVAEAKSNAESIGGLQTAFAQNLTDLATGLNGGLQAVNAGVSASQKAVTDALTSQTANITGAITTAFAGQNTAMQSGFTGLLNTLKGYLDALGRATSTLNDNLTAGFKGVGDQVTQLAGQIAPLGAAIAGIQTSEGALQTSVNGIDARTKSVFDLNAINIGAQSFLTCYQDGGWEATCLKVKGEVGGKANINTGNVGALQQQSAPYSSCLVNGQYDPLCVGRVILAGKGIAQ